LKRGGSGAANRGYNARVGDATPPITAELIWDRDLRFGATTDEHAIVIDSDKQAGPSPMQLLAIGVAGCMAIDVVSILTKGRHPLTGLRASLTGERLPVPPKRFVALTLHFHVSGAVPVEAIERAIALSHEKYCSVWHSLRQDIAFTTTFEQHL